jgi:hypothetical protein
MAERSEKSVGKSRASGLWGLLELLFLGFAIIFGATAFATLLYEIWGFVTGYGWHHYFVGTAWDWLLGMPPLAENMTTWHKILGVSSILPLDATLLVLAWIFSKISKGFEKLT